MIRKIIRIDEDKCIGCGRCAAACHEGAIEMIDGKARLTREDYCDGLGDCLPACPTDAISFEEREAPAFDAVRTAKGKEPEALPCGCPGTLARALSREEAPAAPVSAPAASQLRQWPVQLQLVPTRAPYYENADLLVAADCTAYAYGNFHPDFIRGHITLIGCPKLDSVDYAGKLTAILRDNAIRSVTVARMEVPCCGGLERAVKQALQASGKPLPCRVVTISADGRILE